MSGPANLRRAVALVRTGAPRPDWAVIGGRPIYQFWHLLSPHFRDVLLPPQRRSDGGGFSWSWRDAGAGGPPTGAELAELRQRLKLAEQTFTATTTAPPWQQDPDDAGGPGSLGAKVKAGAQAMVRQFAGASDAALAEFVCRTESGPMIHSWGASVPAVPCFIDALECEIGGTVLLGEESGAGLKLVLENRAGAIIAQTRTDAAGLFLFRRIPGGDYRIRVEHRGDFPTTGFSVSIEQDSIYGLELRRGAAVATFSRVPSRAPFESRTPVEMFSHVPFPPRRRSRRPLLIVLLALALSGGAGLAWFWSNGSAGGGRGGVLPSWQSANGATGTGPAEARGAGPRAVAASGGVSGANRVSSGRTPAERVPHEGSPGAGRIMPPAEKNTGAGPADTARRPEPVKAVGLTAESGTANGGDGGRATPSEDAAADGREAGTEPEEKFAEGRRGSRTKVQRAAKAPSTGVPAGASPTAADHGQGDAALDGAETANDSADPGGKSGEGSARPRTRARPGSGSAGGAALPDAAGGVGAAPYGPSAEAADGGANSTGPGLAARAGASRGGGAGKAVPGAGLSAKSGGGEGASGNGAEAENSGDLGRTRTGAVASAARAKPAGGSGGVASGAGENPAEATAPATELAEAAARAADGKTAGAVAGSVASARRPVAPGTHRDAPVTPSDSTDRPATSSVDPRRAPQSRRGQKSDTEVGGGDVPDVVGPVRDAGAAADEPELPQRHRLMLAVGGLRLLRDAILPTLPVPVGRAEPIERLRRRLQDEQESRIPPGFRPAATARGVALDIPASVFPSDGPPRWLGTEGAAPVGAGVQGSRAELTWSGRNGVTAGAWRLVRPDGTELAHVALESGGVVTVRAIPAVRAAVWVAVEDVAGSAVPGNVNALEWRTLEGGAVPPAWRRIDSWSGGRGARLDLPLGAGGGGLQPVALLDPSSGWAVIFEVGRR